MDIVAAFISQVEADAYLLAHVTSPFLRAASIRAGLRAVADEGHDSALSVTPLREFAWMDGKPLNYDLSAVPRTQNLPVIFVETSGFFVFRKEIAVEHGRRIGFNPKFVEVSKIEAIDIDYPEDFAIADALFNFGLTR
jgi:CMP-N-acetylneuraminic acid synthetase